MNNWDILLSKESLKFLHKNHLGQEVVTDAIKLALRKFSVEDINIDLKKLNPPYDGYFRIRHGRMRITFKIDFETHTVDVAETNWRGSSYK